MEDINYDEVLCEEGLTITIGGEKYEVKPPSLDQILAFEKMAAGLAKFKNVGKVIDQIKKIIRTVFDTVPNDVLDQCSLKVLRKMLVDVRRYIQQSIFPGVEEREIADKKK